MTALERLAGWKQSGTITEMQYDALSAIVAKRRFSVFFELNVLLYLGVISLVAGIGWTIQTYAATMGAATVVTGLTILCLGSFTYCLSRAKPFSSRQMEAPTFSFDYVLYLGCLSFAVELGYVEAQFHLLQGRWDYYLLLSSALFWILAYRFDNRFVLSLALSTFAGWCGVRVSHLGLMSSQDLRISALFYGAAIIAIGISLHRFGLKKHLTETYFHIAALVMFTSLFSALYKSQAALYFIGLITLATIAVIGGIHFRRFLFVAYAILFTYAGVSTEILRTSRMDSTGSLAYVAISGSIVVYIIVDLSRRFGREA